MLSVLDMTLITWQAKWFASIKEQNNLQPVFPVHYGELKREKTTTDYTLLTDRGH